MAGLNLLEVFQTKHLNFPAVDLFPGNCLVQYAPEGIPSLHRQDLSGELTRTKNLMGEEDFMIWKSRKGAGRESSRRILLPA
jgi:hypothetical protein